MVMTYVVSLNYIKPLSEVDRHLEAHREWLNKGYQNKLFLMSGPKEPRTGGVIIANASNEEILRHYLSQDPFVINGVVETEIIPFYATLQSNV